MKSNIILIGMPGAGKSTLGKSLAAHLNLEFTDSDALIEQNEAESLQAIMDAKGYLFLRQLEEATLLATTLQNQVLATGGSAVYSHRAMCHLQRQGQVVYLQVSFEQILDRIDNETQRGIARPAGQSLREVYEERLPLYQRYADLVVDNDQTTAIETINSYF